MDPSIIHLSTWDGQRQFQNLATLRSEGDNVCYAGIPLLPLVSLPGPSSLDQDGFLGGQKSSLMIWCVFLVLSSYEMELDDHVKDPGQLPFRGLKKL